MQNFAKENPTAAAMGFILQTAGMLYSSSRKISSVIPLLVPVAMRRTFGCAL
jgi:hypothetical protein